ncbi:MAG: hypothetical protein OIN89_02560 [Candidatus Methanoperedens sp.]|jgi:hypothetical protein|nr:hypothetical protein [Candidatus Methanoperedens sp.]PKL54273.1 MAG: hypothetical protein CVV36_02520 [Candidatus Methanoperedenaceae archaeon HGW-Methanoperedenaceae-1]
MNRINILLKLVLVGFAAIALSGVLSERVNEEQYVTIKDNSRTSFIPFDLQENVHGTLIGSTPSLIKPDNIEKPGIFSYNYGKVKKPGLSGLTAGSISLQALKGTNDTDLAITFTDKNTTLASRIKVETYYINNTKKYVTNYNNVAIVDGAVNLILTDLSRNEVISVWVTIGKGKSSTEMAASTTVKLRPDIAIQSVDSPISAKPETDFEVGINITELNKDYGADFTLSINEGNNTLYSAPASIAQGSNLTVNLQLNLTKLGLHNLSVLITASNPAEYSILNNRYDFTIEIVSGVIIIEDGISIKALKGISNTDLYIIFKDSTTSFANNIEVNAYNTDGTVKYTNNYNDVEISGGTANLVLTNLNQDEKVSVTVTIEDGSSVFQMVTSTNVKLRPDLAIQGVTSPTSVLIGSFDAGIDIAELNNDFGSNFTLSIIEGGSTLASTTGYVKQGGTYSGTLSLQLVQPGTHNLTAVITNLDTAEYSASNNRYDFTVEITKPQISLVGYTSRYYSQSDDYYSSKDLTVESRREVSVYSENTISENFKYVFTINTELVSPIDYLYFRISNESGMVEEHESINIEPSTFASGKTISTVYYNDTGAVVTITSSAGLTEVKLVKSVKYRNVSSSGYDYYSETVNTSWSTGSADETGLLMNSREIAGVYFEIIDDGLGYGGYGLLNITAPEYSNTTLNSEGVTGYRNIETYYTIKTGVTSVN